MSPIAKPIPPARDRLQSRILVAIAIPLLCYSVVSELQRAYQWGAFSRPFIGTLGRYDSTLPEAIAASAIFALASWRLKAATPLAAACGGLICLLITQHTAWEGGSSIVDSGLTPLILLFVLTFEATRLGRERMATVGVAENRKGRNAAQVIANLGIAGLCSSIWGLTVFAAWGYARIGSYQGGDDKGIRAYVAINSLPILAVLTEATADTVSSEIGQALGGTPFMLTTLLRVPPGTDGAISLTGTLAGIAAAALIAATPARPPWACPPRSARWPSRPASPACSSTLSSARRSSARVG
jgi:uncharacterized membrane protein